MNILIVSQCYYPDSFLINEIAPRLVEEGHSVTVLAGLPNQREDYIRYRQNKIKGELINGVIVYRCFNCFKGNGVFSLSLNYISFVIFACLKVLGLKNKYDVVFCYQLSPVTQAIPAILYKKLHHKKLLLYCLDIFPESVLSHTSRRGVIFKFVSWLSKKIYNACDLIAVTSRSFINYNHDVNLVPTENQVYLPQHADCELVNLPEKRMFSAPYTFLFAGNIGYAQRMDVIVDASAQLSNDYNFTIHIVGDGSKLEEVKEYVKQKKQNQRFIFHGRVKKCEMSAYYEKADALLLTLRCDNRVGETIPGKLQTYMSAGKPIVASINGSSAEVIGEAKCGLVVPACDYLRLSEAMRKFMDCPRDYAECGFNAREYFLRNFTIDVFMRQLTYHLQSLSKQVR